MIFDKKIIISGKILTTVFLLIFFFIPLFGKTITFTFTGTTLKEDLKTYLMLKKYLQSNSLYNVDIRFARTYAEVISDIKESKTDIAYVCGSTYTILKDTNNAKLLAIPILHGKDQYYAYIIALKDSKYKNLLDFKGSIFAFTDIDSTSGSIAPTYFILKHGYKVNSFFKNLIYTYDHGESIQAVLDRFVDGASIDSLVYSQYIKKYPKTKNLLRVVQKIGPFTISPIIAKKNLDQKDFLKLQKLFIDMDKSKVGRKILSKLNINKFEKPKGQDYKKIYKMVNFIKEYQ